MMMLHWNDCNRSCCSENWNFHWRISENSENPEFDREKALEQQITLLTLKKQHLEKLIALAEKIRTTGGNVMDFNAFDTQKIKEYAERAKKEWGATTEYQEFEAKTPGGRRRNPAASTSS